MRKSIIAVIVLSVCLFSFQRSSFAEDEAKGIEFPPIRVEVVITAADEEVKNQIESYIKRELRALGDVIVTDTDAETVFRIMIRDVYQKDIDKEGQVYAGGTVVLIPMKSFTEFCVKDSQAPEEELFTPENQWFPTAESMLLISSGIWTAGKEEIENASKGLVASLDISVIEVFRKAHQDRLDGLKNEATPTSPKAQEK